MKRMNGLRRMMAMLLSLALAFSQQAWPEAVMTVHAYVPEGSGLWIGSKSNEVVMPKTGDVITLRPEDIGADKGEATVTLSENGSLVLTLEDICYTGSGHMKEVTPEDDDAMGAEPELMPTGETSGFVRSLIYYGGSAPLSIVLKGKSTLSFNGITDEEDLPGASAGIYVDKACESAVITGDGSLDVSGGEASIDSAGIFCKNNLAIGDAVELMAAGFPVNSDAYSFGIASAEDLYINGGKVIAVGGGQAKSSYGLYSSESIKIDGGRLTVRGGSEANESIGLKSGSDLEINGGSLTAEGGAGGEEAETETDKTCGISCNRLEINGGRIRTSGGDEANESIGLKFDHAEINGGKLTAAGGDYSYVSYGIYGDGELEIKGGSVEAFGGVECNPSIGLMISDEESGVSIGKDVENALFAGENGALLYVGEDEEQVGFVDSAVGCKAWDSMEYDEETISPDDLKETDLSGYIRLNFLPEYDLDGSGLWVGDSKEIMKDGEIKDTGASAGTASVKLTESAVTLTLEDFEYSGWGHMNEMYETDDDSGGFSTASGAIMYDGLLPLRIILKGENSLSMDENSNDLSGGIFSMSIDDLEITGDGSLKVKGSDGKAKLRDKKDIFAYYSYGIYAGGDILLDGVEVETAGGDIDWGCDDFYLDTETIGIYSYGPMTVNGGKLTALGGNVTKSGNTSQLYSISSGVYCLEDFKTGEKNGTYPQVTAKGGKVPLTVDEDTYSSGICAAGFDSKGGEVKAEGNEGKYSMGIYVSESIGEDEGIWGPGEIEAIDAANNEAGLNTQGAPRAKESLISISGGEVQGHGGEALIGSCGINFRDGKLSVDGDSQLVSQSGKAEYRDEYVDTCEDAEDYGCITAGIYGCEDASISLSGNAVVHAGGNSVDVKSKHKLKYAESNGVKIDGGLDIDCGEDGLLYAYAYDTDYSYEGDSLTSPGDGKYEGPYTARSYGLNVEEDIKVNGGNLTANALKAVSTTAGGQAARSVGICSNGQDGLIIGVRIIEVVMEGENQALDGILKNNVAGVGCSQKDETTGDYKDKTLIPASPTGYTGDITGFRLLAFPYEDEEPFYIYYESNGGKGTMERQSFRRNEQVTLKDNQFTNPGLTFAGWNTRSDGKGTQYAPKAVVNSTDLISAGVNSVTLYAQWSSDAAEFPDITSQPSDLELVYGYKEGSVLTVQAVAKKDHTLSYQWYSNSTKTNTGGVVMEGETGASYAIPTGLPAGFIGYYYCVVTSERNDSHQKTSLATIAVSVSVVKTPAIITNAPMGRSLVYTLSAQVLAVPGMASGGTLMYALGNKDKATEPYSEKVPERSEMGTYYIWYYVKGDDDHSDTKPAYVITYITATLGGRIVFVDDDGNESATYDTVFTGDAIKPMIRVYDGNRLLSEQRDYRVSYGKNNKNAYTLAYGETGFDINLAPSVIVKMKGKYSGTKAVYFTIQKAEMSEVAGSDLSAVSNGKAQVPKYALTYGKQKLKAGKDYDLSYEKDGQPVTECRNPGEYAVTATGKGNYTGTKDLTFTLVAKGGNTVPVSKLKIKLDKKSYPFTGEQIQPAVSVKKGKAELKKDEDYSLDYGENTAAGRGYVTISGKGVSCAGSITLGFDITGTPMKKVQISGGGSDKYKPKDLTYNGSWQIQDPESYALSAAVIGGGSTLVEGTHFKVSYEGNQNAGKAVMVFEGIPEAGFTGSVKKNFKILPESLTGAKIPDDITEPLIGAGAVPIPEVTLDLGDSEVELEEGIDYIISYKDNKAVSDGGKNASLTIKGYGNYKDKKTASFTVTKADLDNGTIFINAPDFAYKAKDANYKQKVKVIDSSGKALSMGDRKDYTLSYYKDSISDENLLNGKERLSNNTRVFVVAKAAGSGKYTGTLSASFLLKDKEQIKDVAKAKFTILPMEHTGAEVVPEGGNDGNITALFGKDTAIPYLTDADPEGSDGYRVLNCYNNVRQGSATVILQGDGSYSGIRAVKFKVGTRSITSILEGWDGFEEFRRY